MTTQNGMIYVLSKNQQQFGADGNDVSTCFWMLIGVTRWRPPLLQADSATTCCWRRLSSKRSNFMYFHARQTTEQKQPSIINVRVRTHIARVSMIKFKSKNEYKFNKEKMNLHCLQLICTTFSSTCSIMKLTITMRKSKRLITMPMPYK